MKIYKTNIFVMDAIFHPKFILQFNFNIKILFNISKVQLQIYELMDHNIHYYLRL